MKKIIILVVALVAVGWFLRFRFSAPIPSTSSVVSTPPEKPKPPVETPPPPAAVAKSPRVDLVPSPSPVDASKPASADAASYPQMSLAEVLQPNNVFQDAVFGVSVTYPEGWSVQGAIRWGQNNRENTVFFVPPEGSAAVPSMYYQKYPSGAPDPGDPEAMLRDMAQKKEESRSGGGSNDYKNDPGSFVFRDINGYPALSYFATYTQGDQLQAEYFTRILGEKGYVMFFVRGPAKDVEALIPPVYQMSGTVKPP